MLKFEPVEHMKKQGTYQEVKIRCRYCDLRDNCHRRQLKESYESAGFVTKCPFTPNVPGKKKKK